MKKRKAYILQKYRFRGGGEQWLFCLHAKMKEKFNSVYEGIMNKWHDWKSQHHLRIEHLVDYSKHLVVAASIFVFLFAFFFAFFFQFRLDHTDAVSARYMLSALVQSQAAIVAIVITLTLIVVQFTASAYSPRVVDIIKNNLGMHILLLLYGTSIFYGLIVLSLIEGNKGELVSQSVILPLGPISISLEFCIHLALILGIFTFVALVPYIPYTIDLLKPENIIKQFASKITKDVFLKPLLFSMKSDYAKKLKNGPVDNLVKMEFKNNKQTLSDKAKVSTIDEKHWEIVDGEERYKIENTEIKLNRYHNSRKDPIQPIVDIIRGSIRKYDFETTRVGLSAVTEQVISVIDSNCEEEISNSFCTQLQGVGKLAASVTDEKSTIDVIENLKNFSEYTVEKHFDVATKKGITSLGTVGIATARKGSELEDATKKVTEALGNVGKKAAVQKLEQATEGVATSLGAVGIATARKGTELEDAVKEAADALGDMGKLAAEKNLEDATKQVAASLGDVGKAAAENELKIATKQLASSLGDVGIAAAKNELKIATKQVASSLGDVGKAAAENDLKIATGQVAKSLGAVGEAAVGEGKEPEEATKQVAMSLGAVGEAAAGKGKELEEVTEQVASSLGDLGENVAGKRFKDATKEVAKSLGTIGKTAVKKRLNDATRNVINSLRAVGKLAVKNELEKATEKAIISLGTVGKTAVDEGKEFGDIAEQAVFSLGFVGKKAADEGKKFNVLIIRAILSLAEVGKAAADNNELKCTTEAASSLGDIGKITATKGKELKSQTMHAISSLEAVGKVATGKGVEFGLAIEKVVLSLLDIGTIVVKKRELKNVDQRAASSLAKLTIQAPKIVEDTIYKFELRVSDHDSFLKFKKLYEQELENETKAPE